MPEVLYQPLPFDEAIAAFRSKIILTPDEYKKLEEAARQKAFSVSGVTEANILSDIYDEILKAMVHGTTLNDFKKALKPTLDALGWADKAYRLDTIFRTNIQSQFNAGHYKQMMEVVEERPYWQYVAVMDDRTRPAHAAMNGKVLPADDPWWDVNFPPNGYNCRCTVITLSDREVQRYGLGVVSGGKDIADTGFGFNPGKATWTPDLSKFPAWLAQKVQEGL